jgi:hypothetical protein
MQAHPAVETIHIECIFAEHFCETSAGEPPRQLHLPQAILGVAKALAEERVQWFARADVRDAPPISNDLDLRSNAFDADFAVEYGQWAPQEIAERARRDSPGGAGRDAKPVQPEGHLVSV